jgi:hypothetical protein
VRDRVNGTVKPVKWRKWRKRSERRRKLTPPLFGHRRTGTKGDELWRPEEEIEEAEEVDAFART